MPAIFGRDLCLTLTRRREGPRFIDAEIVRVQEQPEGATAMDVLLLIWEDAGRFDIWAAIIGERRELHDSRVLTMRLSNEIGATASLGKFLLSFVLWQACPDVSIMKSKLNFSLFRRGGGQTASDVVPSLRGRLRLLRSDAPLRPVQRKRAGGLLRFEELAEAARAGDAPLRRLIT